MADSAATLDDTGLGVVRSRQPLLIVDDEGVSVEASLGACRILGSSRAEVVGRRVADLLEPEARERFVHFWRAFGSTGGHGGPFQLATTAAEVLVEFTVEADVLPSRHLVTIGPPGRAAASPGAMAPDRPPLSLVADSPPSREPTIREREILGLLASGATDGQIATRLDLSPATVQTHVRNAKAKLGARTRAQAVALALKRGLIAAT